MGPGPWLRRHARLVLRIARWEVTKNAGGVDRRTLLIAAVAIVGIGAVAPLAATQGSALDSGLYRVGVDQSSPYYDVVEGDPTFVVADPDIEAVRSDDQEVLIDGMVIAAHARTPKGRAALEELRSTVQRYNDARMREEDNRSAAFPVLVDLRYEDRDLSPVVAPGDAVDDGETDATDGDADDAGGGTDDSTAGTGTDAATGSDGSAGSGSDGDEGGGGTDGSIDQTPSEDGGTPAGDGSGAETPADSEDRETETDSGGPLGGLGGSSVADRLTGGGVSGTPSDIQPPFPFRSLVLAFVFVLPLNFIIQAYGSTMLSERINRRGELLLVAPVGRGDIIVGKTLPYLAAALGFAALITVALQGSALSVLAVTPIALLFLAATFLGAMFARSFKELTFVTVTVTVSLTTYAFVPAIFTDVTPIALISPLTLVVRDLQGQAVGLGEFAFSVGPPTATALVLFGFGAGLYREEDMFTQRPIPLKVLDALAGRITTLRSVPYVTALLLPFVFVTELVVIAGVFALPGELSIPLVLVAVAVVEEVAKSLPVYAGFAHARFDRRLGTALKVGAASGVGFFVAEKATVVAQLADLPQLQVGRAAFNGVFLSAPTLAGLLLAPLALHVVTAAVSAVGARRDLHSYILALGVAVAIHVAYNLTVVMVLGWTA